MATVIEKPDSRQAGVRDGRDWLRLLYTVEDAADYDSAVSALEFYTPESWDEMPRTALEVAPTEATDCWTGRVEYADQPEGDVGEFETSFETGGATARVTQALEVRGVYVPEGEKKPETYGLIGWDGREVRGVDISVPQYRWSETHTFDDAQVTYDYRGDIYRLTGRTNAEHFRGTAPGECLFLGVTARRRPSGKWTITFRFAASPNATNITHVPGIVIAEKRGWDHVDVWYEDREITDTDKRKMIVKKPIAAVVQRVYEEGDYYLMLIGG